MVSFSAPQWMAPAPASNSMPLAGKPLGGHNGFPPSRQAQGMGGGMGFPMQGGGGGKPALPSMGGSGSTFMTGAGHDLSVQGEVVSDEDALGAFMYQVSLAANCRDLYAAELPDPTDRPCL